MDKPITARLKKALEEHPTISTAAELSRASKVTEATVSNWLSNKVQEDQGKGLIGIKLSRALEIRVEWLFTGTIPMRPHSTGSAEIVHVASGEIAPGYLRLPQLDLPAGAGPGVEMDTEPDVVQWIDVAESWAEAHFQRHASRIRVMTVNGDSMVGAGMLRGDLLFVDTGISHFDSDGYYVMQFLDGWQVKRLRANVLLQQVEIVSMLASGEQAQPIPPGQLQELRVGGKVSAWWTLRKH